MKAIEMVMEIELLEGRAPKWTLYPLADGRPEAFSTAEWRGVCAETLRQVAEIAGVERGNCPHIAISVLGDFRSITVFAEATDAPSDAKVVDKVRR